MKVFTRSTTQSPDPPAAQLAADGPEAMPALPVSWPRRLAWLPIPLLLLTMALLWAAAPQASRESPYLLTVLNLVFSTMASGFVAYLIGRSFLIRGTPGLLVLGCGVIAWGSAGLVGVATGLVGLAAGHFDINVFVTIHNVCVWLSALCHLAGAVLSLRPMRAVREASLWIAAAYMVAMGCVALVTVSALAGWTPTFFVQGDGGTPLRYLVLGSATAMFAFTAILLQTASRRPLSAFLYWYTLALGLISVGLFGIMIESVHAGPLSWMGRAGQFLGGAYMLIAAMASVRESHVWGIPLEEALQRERTFVSAVLETVSALVTVLDREGRIVSFNRACEQTTGYSSMEVQGRYLWDFMLVPEEVESVKGAFAKLRAGQFPNEHENYWVAKDGTRRLIHWTNSCLTDSSAAVEYVIGTGVEVTEQRRTQQEREKAIEALRASERFKIGVLNCLASHIAVLDKSGRISAVNEPWARFARENGGPDVERIGVGMDYLEASRAAAVAGDPFAAAAMDGIEAVLQGRQQQFVIEYPCHSPNQQRWFLMHVTANDVEIGGAIVTHTDITQRKRAEESLRESEDKYRNLFENMTEEVHFWKLVRDEDGQIKTWRLMDANPPTLKTWGRALEDIRGKTTDEIFGAGATQHYLPVVQKIMEEGVPHSFEDYFSNLDRYFQFASVPLGEYFITTGMDITSIKKAELALRESEERLRLLSDNLPGSAVYQYIHETDGRVRFLYFSAGIQQLCGVTVTDVLRDAGTLYRQSPPEYIERLVEAEDRSKRELSDIDMELPMCRPDGQVRWMRLHSRPRRLPDGRTIWDGVQIDITEQKRAEEALRQSREDLDRAQEVGQIGWWRLDTRRNVLSWSDESYRIFGVPKGTPLTYEKFLAIVHPDDRRYLETQWNAGLRGEAYDIEHRVVADGQVKWVREKAYLEFDDAGELLGGFGITQDITHRKNVEEALAAAKAAAEAANQAKSQFLTNISHELRTPMNAILGMIDVALPKAVDPTVQDCLQTAKGSADLLLTLLNELLDSAKIESGKLELESAPFSLRRMLDQITRVLSMRASEKGLCFYCRLPDETPDAIMGDRTRLQQVLLNLAGNAIKFTERGEVEIGLHALSHDGTVCLEFAVRDTGIGIPPSNIDRLFEPFSQADASMSRRFGGTGLGLSISKNLVEMMGGRIWAESEMGKGSTFHFTVRLPLAKELPSDFEAPVALPTAACRQLRVLLVEDNPANQKLATYILQDRGHVVEIAGDGQEALCLTDQNRYDVILMDVQMPGMNGLEATAAIRKREAEDQRVPIIAMTAHAMKGDRDRCLSAGMNAYLSKPVDAQEMIGLVESLANDAEPVPQSLPGRSSPAETFPPTPAVVFDLEEAIKRCVNSTDMVRDMIQCFFDEVDELLPQMRSALKKGDLGEIGRLGHRMNGTVAYLGAQPAREAAVRVERFCKSNGGTRFEAEEAVNALEHECNVLKAVLRAHPVAAGSTRDNLH